MVQRFVKRIPIAFTVLNRAKRRVVPVRIALANANEGCDQLGHIDGALNAHDVFVEHKPLFGDGSALLD